jgi:3-hydroxyisobutyrate dehydrogenase-like beta-hydroxyacid dehydrogenase
VFADFSTRSVAVRDRIADRMDAAGVRYADAAIVDSVHQEGTPVNVLASGRGASELEALLRPTRFRTRVLEEGAAGATEVKLCRSGFTKGMAALLVETLLAAQRSGVSEIAQETIAVSLAVPFEELVQSLVGNALRHARRRAEEMTYVVEFVARYLEHAPMTGAASEVLAALSSLPNGRRAEPSVAAVLSQVDDANVF